MEQNREVAEAARRCGFTLLTSEPLPEIEGFAHVMTHQDSGARLLYLQNEDANKAFSISFKTPAADDTGVFHILEHSVLCGSEKFPVKEPFVNLLKTSMQTFLNAMTFPDKTMYPVASTNEQDLLNLMDVYLDAVFAPAIYQKETIFEQEGWHLETAPAAGSAMAGAEEEKRGDAPGEVDGAKTLVYNGVVYNEMKGALSDPDSVLYNTLSAALFPDTTYRFESGGTPGAIPTLTYEAFLDNHRRHYRTDNAYIVLYGDMNLERFLSFIAQEHLAKQAARQSGPLAINPLDLQAPVVNRRAVAPMATAPENACAALGFVVGRASERERMIAVDVLLDALMGSNEAPLKRALLEAGIADDAVGYPADSIAQPFAVVQLKGAKPGAAEVLRETVRAKARELADGGLDHDLVEASLSQAEFTMREGNFGYADGVVYAISALAGWLYGDDDPCAYLRYEAAFSRLHTALDQGYFEQLIREVFLDNDHWALAEVVPVDGDESAGEEAAAVAAASTSSGLEAIEERVATLRAAQEAPDAPEALAALPQLKREDIGEAPFEPAFYEEEGWPLAVLRHDVPSHGIVYAYRYFDLSGVSLEELPYVTVLASVLGKLGTARHSAAEIDVLLSRYLGTSAFFLEAHEKAGDRQAVDLRFVASASALAGNAGSLASLVKEVLAETDFSDKDKIKAVLSQRRLGMEQGFATAGHTAALARVTSYSVPAAALRQVYGGVGYYFFLKELIDGFEERACDLCRRLEELARRIFVDEGSLLSFAGTDESIGAYFAADPLLGGTRAPAALVLPEPEDLHEAFIVPADVSYTAMGYDRRLLDVPYSGSWLVASRILSYDYLWNEVRVKGGAYGAGFQALRSGASRFYSYRDPRIDETLDRFKAAGSWLAAFDPAESEMDGYVVSTVASFDAPAKARELIRRQDGMYLAGYTMEERAVVRDQIIATTADSVRALGPVVAAVSDAGRECTFGSKEIIGRSDQNYRVVDLLGA